MDASAGDQNFCVRNVSPSEAQKMLDSFWRREIETIQNMTHNDFRNPELPLARIKKIMKLDEDVKMISGEAPVLFAKAVEIFIAELSLRAWINTEDNKRRTLQRNDIASGISKYDQFDFLIDIVPREEAKPMKRPEIANANVISQDQLNYFFQMAQQQQLQSGTGQPIQIIQTANQNQPFSIGPQVFQLPVSNTSSGQNQENSVMSSSQVVQLNHSSDSTSANGEKSGISAPLILSNVYNNNADVVQQLPITLSSQQYQTLLQNQNSNQNQQIIISNPQSLTSLPTQFITNTGLMQAIIPTTSSIDQMNSNKLSTSNEDNES